MLSDFSSAIVIDRLRFILAPITAAAYVNEAIALGLT